MTYEEKMLEIFSRHRGQELSPSLVSSLETTCEKEVWQHLPASILKTWKLRLVVGAGGQLELRPEQLAPGGAAELEGALRAEFKERELPKGGISQVSIGFGAPSMPEVPRPAAPTEKEAERTTISSTTEYQASPASPAPPSTTEGATNIVAHAQELGISLPPNSSLLGPFLEAVAQAIHYKARAEKAEALLAQLSQLAGASKS